METPKLPKKEERRSWRRMLTELKGGPDPFNNEDSKQTQGINNRVNAVLAGNIGSTAQFSSTAAKVLTQEAPRIILESGSAVVTRHNGADKTEPLLARDGKSGKYATADVPRGATLNITKIPAVSIPEKPTDPEEVKERADRGELKFEFTPAKTMAIAVYRDGAWSDPQCIPAGSMESGPLADRYGQVIFGGSRAVRLKDGRVALFRPDMHAKRFIDNAKAELIPTKEDERIVFDRAFSAGNFTAEMLVNILEEVVKENMEYIGQEPGKQSLYLAPGLRATKNQLGVHPNTEYTFTCLGVPAGKIFGKPAKLRIETKSHRVAKGGDNKGEIKHAGHYALTFKAKKYAKTAGFDDVVFMDEKNEEVRELSSSNVFFVTKNGILVTPDLSGEILRGVTRDSILEIAEELMEKGIIKGIEERPVGRLELMDMAEAFSCGTGVTMNGIELIEDELCDEPHKFDTSENGMGPVSRAISNVFERILVGEEMENPRYKDWLRVVD